ncbi:MAG: peptidoglycan-N-acetylmuramic acid deacetylase [Actinomycetota bacterium]|nr:peptidoglycan-N-acetylmuramic acid deacetylase [Actinomycetota bacterium]
MALTFDAEHPDRSRCPAGNADSIFDVLADEGVRTSVFIQGRWAQAYPDTAKRIAADGHLIGNHSHHHAEMPLFSEAGFASDVADGQAAIAQITGIDPRPWFRCPFGAGHDDPKMIDGLRALGYRNVHWDVELEDWEPSRTPEQIASDAVEGVRTHGDGAVVLLHTWPAATAEAIRPIISGLRDIGAEFITVDMVDGAS